MESANLCSGIPRELPEELTDTLARGEGVRIERIVSRGHRSPSGFWYDQDENEWVLIVKGAATLRFAEGDRLVELGPGGYVDIPAHARHRVESTADGTDTVWLAIFYR